MPETAEIWKQALPVIQNQITGRGVWAALNAAVPVAYEDGTFVIGLPNEVSELAGHLRIPATKRLIETIVSRNLNSQTRVALIDGTTQADYEVYKRREAERRRLQELEMNKMRAELQARTSWDGVYEQLSRRWSAVSNKSLPQAKARFFEEAVELVATARKEQTNYDDLGERNFARCIERLAQYGEVPSTLVAVQVLQRAGEL